MRAPHAIHEILVEPDYGQFYLRRSESEPWGSADVPSDAHERYLWSNGTFVMVGTVRKYGTTRLQVRVLATAPKLLPEDEWQHVVEESLGPGGDLEVFSWGGGEPLATVAIPHESVRLRVNWAGLVVENTFEGMDENGNSDEGLLLQL